MSIRFNLPNGWTLSICKEIAPAICSVAAWPTSQGEPKVGCVWFDFAGESDDVRCYCLDDMLTAINAVRNAEAVL